MGPSCNLTRYSMSKLLTCVVPLTALPVFAAQSGCEGDCDYGTGTYSFSNGDRYEGEWRNTKRHGWGTYFFANGVRYEGEWKDDRQHGQGTYYFANGDHFKGEWVKGERESVEICIHSACFAVAPWIYDVINFAPVTVGFVAAVLVIWGVQRRYESKLSEALRSVALSLGMSFEDRRNIDATNDPEKLPFSRRLLKAIFWGGVAPPALLLFFIFVLQVEVREDFAFLPFMALMWPICTFIFLLPHSSEYGGGGNGGD